MQGASSVSTRSPVVRKFPIIRFKLPVFVQERVDQHYLDISLSRVLPLAVLVTFGVLVGLVFNHGLGHPHDKIIHIVFYALLTLSIHALFCCRLRISAVVAFVLGIIGELVQGVLPHHSMSLGDAIANGIGVALIVAMIALMRSETKQALKDARQEEVDYDEMGLQPVRQRYLSGSPSEGSGFPSEK